MIDLRKRSIVAAVGAALVLAAGTGPAQAARWEGPIVLPGASSAEGIAAGAGSTFYAGDLFAGDIFRGDVRAGTAELFIDAPAGRLAVGMAADVSHGLLFVAGGLSGSAYVYDTATGADLGSFLPAGGAGTFINDVAVTRTGAWFTDSGQAKLYFLPVSASGELGAMSTLELSGPAADLSGEFNNNGIQATADGRTLVVAHSGNGVLNTVDPATGDSATIAGLSVPSVDGFRLEGRTVHVVQNFLNQITVAQLSGDLTSGQVVKTITSDDFQTPTTVARFGDRLAVVNAKFDTGVPPTADEYEVVVVDR
jgi:sugar lactone lactonase YvrE